MASILYVPRIDSILAIQSFCRKELCSKHSRIIKPRISPICLRTYNGSCVVWEITPHCCDCTDVWKVGWCTVRTFCCLRIWQWNWISLFLLRIICVCRECVTCLGLCICIFAFDNEIELVIFLFVGASVCVCAYTSHVLVYVFVSCLFLHENVLRHFMSYN